MTAFFGFLVGALTGVLSAFGIGGGSLLLVYLTTVAGVAQQEAQGINLLYFLPTALCALPSHVENGFVEQKTVLPAVLAGLVLSAGAAFLSNGLDVNLLRKLFGGFLLIIGLRELFHKEKPQGQLTIDN
jgi:uncharacterized membrane protein YfcA